MDNQQKSLLDYVPPFVPAPRRSRQQHLGYMPPLVPAGSNRPPELPLPVGSPPQAVVAPADVRVWCRMLTLSAERPRQTAELLGLIRAEMPCSYPRFVAIREAAKAAGQLVNVKNDHEHRWVARVIPRSEAEPLPGQPTAPAVPASSPSTSAGSTKEAQVTASTPAVTRDDYIRHLERLLGQKFAELDRLHAERGGPT